MHGHATDEAALSHAIDNEDLYVNMALLRSCLEIQIEATAAVELRQRSQSMPALPLGTASPQPSARSSVRSSKSAGASPNLAARRCLFGVGSSLLASTHSAAGSETAEDKLATPRLRRRHGAATQPTDAVDRRPKPSDLPHLCSLYGDLKARVIKEAMLEHTESLAGLHDFLGTLQEEEELLSVELPGPDSESAELEGHADAGPALAFLQATVEAF